MRLHRDDDSTKKLLVRLRSCTAWATSFRLQAAVEQAERILVTAQKRLGEAQLSETEMTIEERCQQARELRISPVTWQAFELTAWEKWSGARVAAHLHMTVAAVYMAKKRVQRMPTEEIHRLESSPVESEGSP